MSDAADNLNESQLFNKIENYIQELNKLHQDINNRYAKNNIYGILNISVLFYEKALELIALSKHIFQYKIIQVNTEKASSIKKNMNLLKNILENLRKKRDEWLDKTNLMQDSSFAQMIQNGEERLQNIEDKICYFLRVISSAEKKEQENIHPKMKRYKLQ